MRLWMLCSLLVWSVGCGQLEELLNGAGEEEDKLESYDGLSMATETTAGVAFELRAKDDEISRGTDRFLLCSEESIDRVSTVRLWMPMHNHGSSSVKLKGPIGKCREIREVNFSMEGRWEVQFTLDDEDNGAFSMQVAD